MKQRRSEMHCRAIAFIFAFWFAISWIQVIKDNSTGYGSDVSWWNMFAVLGCIDANASEHMALHEQRKGEANVEPYCKYTDEDLMWLAHIINAEGGGASYVTDDMCYGIGSVVLNRVESDIYPNTIQEVITQQGQYSSCGSRLWDIPITERSLEIAQELIDTGSKYPSNVLFQAEFTQGSGVYEKVQNMYFCYR